MERYWQVFNEGVRPVMLNKADVESDPGFEHFFYKGVPTFENFSRAELCWYEYKSYKTEK